MKKILNVLMWVVIVIGVAVLGLVLKAIHDQKLQAEDQQNMIKTDDELIGEHFYLKRDGKEDVDLNLYLIDDGEKHPLVINIHGGAFIAGDADTLDTQSDRISHNWNANVITVNYKLMKGEYTKQYAVDEIKDTVKYFIDHSDEYSIDVGQIYILGYSAGGYHAMASALQLHLEGIDVKGQIICYGFLSDMMEQFNELSDEQRRTLPSALFLLAGDEPIGKGSLEYEEALRNSGIFTEVKVYDGAMHGFIEENNPEYADLHSHASMSYEQEIMARDAENYIKDWIGRHR
ncbi:MAG: alpha/beta hydrolase [Oscillospiraceae bacterium]|nr:alpha/beta hydrolase [Oscillospiraceae bacterium]